MLASLERGAVERLALRPEDRLDAVRQVIRGARKRILLGIFKCNEPSVLAELAAARKRGVEVEAIVTARAGGPRRKLRRLRRRLEDVGVVVREPRDVRVKYHAKYIVADDRAALVGSLNLTKKCFRSSCDFALLTTAPDVIDGLQRLFAYDTRLPGADVPHIRSARLVIAPENARHRVQDLIASAERQVGIIDPRLSDGRINKLLRAKMKQGVRVDALDGDTLCGLTSHGKLLLVDERVALVSSMSLSRSGLDLRRELGVVVTDLQAVAALAEFFRAAVRARSGAGRWAPASERATRGAAAFAQGFRGPTKLEERRRGVPAINDDEAAERDTTDDAASERSVGA